MPVDIQSPQFHPTPTSQDQPAPGVRSGAIADGAWACRAREASASMVVQSTTGVVPMPSVQQNKYVLGWPPPAVYKENILKTEPRTTTMALTVRMRGGKIGTGER